MKRIAGILCMFFVIIPLAFSQQVGLSNMEFMQEDGDGTWHLVGKGETLYSISQKYDVPISVIKANNSLDTDVIYRNQRLLIKPGEKVTQASRGMDRGQANARVARYSLEEPVVRSNNRATVPTEMATKAITIEKNKYYQVKAGDNIRSIADTYETTPEQLMAWNYTDNFNSGDVIIVGKMRSTVDVEDNKINTQPKETPKSYMSRGVDQTNNAPGTTRGIDAAETLADRINDRTTNNNQVKTNYVMPLNENVTGEVIESGKYLAAGDDPSVKDTRFYAYHKTLPIGSFIRMDIPSNAGFVEVRIVGRLNNNIDAVIGLSPACVAVLNGSGMNSGDVAFAYDLNR